MSEGTYFGKYFLLKRLAAGGMGELYLARQSGPAGFEKILAIKTILPHLVENKEMVDSFLGEARLAAKLTHSNVIQIFDLGEVEGTYFIAMEYIHGKSLSDVITKAERVGENVHIAHAAEILRGMCDGCSYAHNLTDITGQRLGIIHRDINPQNVLISYNGEVKVIDFGIAKSELSVVKTEAGVVKGKFIYMSPEQSAAQKLDKRSDIFALGITFYEALTGINPFKKPNVVLTLEAIQRLDPDPPSALNPEATAFDEATSKALSKDREGRYQDAADMSLDIQVAMRSGGVPNPPESLADFMSRLFADEKAQELKILQDTSEAQVAVDKTIALSAAQVSSGPHSAPQPMHTPPPQQVPQPGYGQPQPGYQQPQPGYQQPQPGYPQPGMPQHLSSPGMTPQPVAPPVYPTPVVEKKGGIGKFLVILILLIGIGGGGAYLFLAKPPFLANIPGLGPMILGEDPKQKEEIDKLLAQAQEAEKAEKWKEAAEAYDKILALVAEHEQATKGKEAADKKVAEAEKAKEDEPKELSAADKRKVASLIQKANLKLKIRKYDEAIELCDQALDIDPENSQAKALRRKAVSSKRRAATRAEAPRPAPTPERKPEPAPTPAAAIGKLVVNASPAATLTVNGSSVGNTPGRADLRGKSGTIEVSGGSAPYAVKMTYEESASGLTLTMATDPWSIVKVNGLSKGSTRSGPIKGLELGSAPWKVDLFAPGKPPMTLFIRFSK